MFVLICVMRGVIETVRVFKTEDEAKAYVVPKVEWMDFGYKQGAHLNEYRSYELFKVEGS